MANSLTISDLNSIYDRSNEIDSSLFSEQRSNCLLAAGEHYSKKDSTFWSKVRDSVQVSDETRLRLTKNHAHRITNIYINNIFALCPGVSVLPKNEKELQDQKTAELNEAVWKDWKQQINYSEEVRKDIEDFVKIGEVAAKLFFDPMAGEFLGYEPLPPDPYTGQVPLDEQGQPAVDKSKPMFRGKICSKRIYGFNLLREPTSSDSITEGVVTIRYMAYIKDLKQKYKDDEDKLRFLVAGENETFMVFDSAKGSYADSKEQVMIREMYQPPCSEYPMGHYWISTSLGILEEGDLPGGIWPIIFTGMDDIPTTPRKRSIMKVIRPYIAEVNRAASAIATQQITLGDDKLLVMAGSKITQSAKLPGVRVLNFTGMPPTVMPGRSGDQYLGYMQSQISEMYQAANIDEDQLEKTVQSTDSVAELLKVARHKKKFSLYAQKIEHYQVKKCETVLELAKFYYDDNALIPAIGRAEYVNIPEFRSSEKLCYRISLEPSNEDYETKFGKYLQFNTILQYVGNKLEKDDIGNILRAMPYVNNEKIFGNFTLNGDIADNTMLALERGEYPETNVNYDHDFMIKKLTKRTTEADFVYLDPQIQQNYKDKIKEHNDFKVEQMMALKQAQSELIPATGPLVKVELYVDDPENPGKTAKAKMPTDSLVWLKNQLSKQGIQLEQLAKIQQGQVADMANEFMNRLGNVSQAEQQNPENQPGRY